ncbi:Peptide deformylase [bioreactor metagenome]|uniref:Peptide deformylase n=1 Tax=bioreactor metagenome TaxID=1076179 RepID=A0A645EGJ2_9ZZZZ
MAAKNILTIGEELLRKKSHPVTKFDQKLQHIVDDLCETLKYYEGAGLAEPQIGIMRRIFVVDTGEKIMEFINPEIIQAEQDQKGPEGCLSIPGKQGMVVRPYFVTVKAQDKFGNMFEMSGEGNVARAFCHENDHLDGKLYIDIATEINDIDHDSGE